MEKMTIHRGLAELKLIDARIEKQILEIEPTGIYQKGKLVNGFIREEDFRNSAESKLQSATDLIARKNKIKSAIVKANGQTDVSIAGKSMTIADAINYKASVKFKKSLIASLLNKHRAKLSEFNKNNEIINKNAQALLEAAVGKDNAKTAAKETVDAIQKPYLEANEFHLFDPVGVASLVEKMEKEVSDFEAEVDAVLSEANSVTFIEF